MLLEYHLRRKVVEGAAKGAPGVGIRMHAPAEVSELNGATCTDHDVLGLEVAMHDAAFVHVPNCIRDGTHNVCTLRLQEKAVLHAPHHSEEFAIWCIFKHEVDFVSIPEITK